MKGTVGLTDVVGKEGTKIDAGPLALILDQEDLTSTFLEGDEWRDLVLPVLIAAGKERVAEESGIPVGTVRHTLEGRTPSPYSLPRPNNERPVSRSSEHAGDHEACVVFALVAVPDVLERNHDISLSGIAC